MVLLPQNFPHMRSSEWACCGVPSRGNERRTVGLKTRRLPIWDWRYWVPAPNGLQTVGPRGCCTGYHLLVANQLPSNRKSRNTKPYDPPPPAFQRPFSAPAGTPQTPPKCRPTWPQLSPPGPTCLKPSRLVSSPWSEHRTWHELTFVWRPRRRVPECYGPL